MILLRREQPPYHQQWPPFYVFFPEPQVSRASPKPPTFCPSPPFEHLQISSCKVERGSNYIMSEKKRKAQAELSGQPSPKRPSAATTKPRITVRYMRNPDVAKPVIGICPLCKIENLLGTTDWPKRLLLAHHCLEALSSKPLSKLRTMNQNYSSTLRTILQLTSRLLRVEHLPITTLSTTWQSTTPFRILWTSPRLER